MTGGLVKTIAAGSVAAAAGLRPGDEVIAINGRTLRDLIGAQFHPVQTQVPF